MSKHHYLRTADEVDRIESDPVLTVEDVVDHREGKHE